MNIILLGYRGSGKTSIGKILADQLWKSFADVDQEIIQRFDGLAISDIWQQHGEPAFRQMEIDVTRELCARDEHVIALGGGTVMQPQAHDVVAAADANRIYLYCEPATLYQRISSDPSTSSNRPDLTSRGGGLAEVEAVLAERDPIYRDVADVVFDVTHLNIEDGVRYLIDRCLR